MLIIRRIFHISTHCFSCAFAIDHCLALRPFVASLFFLGCALGVFYCYPTSPPTCSSRLLLFCGFWGLACVWLHDFFCGALLFFGFRRFLALLPFVCVVFPVLAANKRFFLTCLPPMSQVCSDVFQLFFQRFMWNIVVFSMIYCLFTVCFLRYPRRYSVVFVALFFWFLRVDTRFYAACMPIVYYWHLLGVDVVA